MDRVRRDSLRPGVLALLLVGVSAVAASCSRPPPAAEVPTPAATTPREALNQLIELRDERQFAKLPELVVHGRGDDVVEFLMAVDNFLSANRRLCDWLRDEVGVGISQTIDQSYVVDDLGVYAGDGLAVFSRGIELLDLVEDEGVARVSFSTPGRVSARAAILRKSAGVWRYDPGQGYNEHLPAAFHEMAGGLDLIRDELEHGIISADAVRNDPGVLVEKVRARLRRGVALLSKAQIEAADASQ